MAVIRKPAVVKALIIAGRCHSVSTQLWPLGVVVSAEYPQVRAVTEPPPGQLQHPGTAVEPGHDGTPVAQRREQRARAAARVQDPPAGYVPGQGQGQGRGPLVIGVEAYLVRGRVSRTPRASAHARTAMVRNQ
jgi:hypothetical protein